MADAMIAETLKGDVQAFNAIADRMEGKPLQDVSVDGNITVSFDPSLKQDET